MEINKTQSINFGAKSLYPMKLKRVTGQTQKLLKADFAQLSPKSKKDFRLVESLKDAWATTNFKNNYINDIRNGFKNEISFFVQESKYFITRFSARKGKMIDRTATITATKPLNAKTLKIEFIQSAPQKPPITKGGGECTLLGVVKYAKEKGFKRIELESTNDFFYDYMGFKRILNKKPDKKENYYFPSYKFDSFIKRVEKKYEINK